METTHLKEKQSVIACSAATIGVFDGVHQGHRYLLEQLRRTAEEQGLLSQVITFDRHPRQVLPGAWQPQLLTTLAEKERLLAEAGIDRLSVLHFNEQLAALSARQFMQQELYEKLGVRVLLTGYDNRFGHRTPENREGFDDYVGYGREVGIKVVQADPLLICGQAVNSSLIRRQLCEGRVGDAIRCLGRPYSLGGTVVHGEQMGHRLGFPTANLQLDSPLRLVPKNGVYAVKVTLNPLAPKPTILTGMTNIGLRPTFDGHRQTIETHIFNFHDDLYGKPIRLDFIARLRDEQHFDSPEQLAAQMAHDAEKTNEIITSQS